MLWIFCVAFLLTFTKVSSQVGHFTLCQDTVVTLKPYANRVVKHNGGTTPDCVLTFNGLHNPVTLIGVSAAPPGVCTQTIYINNKAVCVDKTSSYPMIITDPFSSLEVNVSRNTSAFSFEFYSNGKKVFKVLLYYEAKQFCSTLSELVL